MSRKYLLTYILVITIQQACFSQFSFIDDGNGGPRIQLNVVEGIHKQFKLEKKNDFELRFWINPSDTTSEQSVFILANKGGKWSGRMFQHFVYEITPGCRGKNCMRLQPIQEVPLKNTEFNTLWENLLQNDVLAIPNCCSEYDKNAELILENDGAWFGVELISGKASKLYGYNCPEKLAAKYDYIPIYKKMANIVSAIIDFTGIKGKIKC